MPKYSTTLGSTLRLRGAQLGCVGRDAHAIAFVGARISIFFVLDPKWVVKPEV
jgi:hypothetical protein